jgi:hypothetical protein
MQKGNLDFQSSLFANALRRSRRIVVRDCFTSKWATMARVLRSENHSGDEAASYSSCSMGIRGGDTCGAESRAMRLPILRMRFAMPSPLRFESLRVDDELVSDWPWLAASDLTLAAGTCSDVFAADKCGVASGVDLKLEPEVCDCGTNPRPGISCSKPDPLSGSPPTSASTVEIVREEVDGVN